MLVLSIDFWNTLYRHVGSSQSRAQRRNRYVAAMRDRLSPEMSDGQLDSFSNTVDSFIMDKWRAGQCPSRLAVIEHLCNVYCLKPERAAAFITAMENLFTRDLKPQLAEGAREFLTWAFRYYPLYLVSDTYFLRGHMLRRIMEIDGICHLFKHTLFSDELGVKKPNPKAFQMITMLESCSANDVVHIGDDYQTDCAGARCAGARGVLFGKGDNADPTETLPVDIRSNSFSHLRALLERGFVS